MCVDSRLFRAAATSPDTRGVLTSHQGTGARTPERTQEAKKSPTHRKVHRFRTGRLAFDGQDSSLLPTPRILHIIYMPSWVDSLNSGAMTWSAEKF